MHVGPIGLYKQLACPGGRLLTFPQHFNNLSVTLPDEFTAPHVMILCGPPTRFFYL